MITNIQYIISNHTNPYQNLALEEHLLKTVGEEECILYLWQNEKTVVIGKNQNPWKECKIAELKKDGGKLVRRLSGGGAVFHDLGNLNFTFLVRKNNYDVEKQLEVILRAVNRLGILAKKSGRNDITVEGRKFSGNAFYSDGIHSYHHGTILINVDMSRLSDYLNVAKDKLKSKGVDSVRSRVVNLQEYRPDLNIDIMKEELVNALGEVYGRKPEPRKPILIDTKEVDKLTIKFSSWEWIYGRKLAFSNCFEHRFPWGNIELQFCVSAGVIETCTVYSDSLNTDFIELIAAYLKGCHFTADAMVHALQEVPVEEETSRLQKDIITMISPTKADL